MNRSQLLDHFDRVAEAPEAFIALRRFVLDLAVRGRLVEQEPADQPALTLLKRNLTQKGTDDSVAALTPGDTGHFSLPPSWSWVAVGDAAHVEMGQSPPSEHYNQSRDGIPFYQGKADFGKKHPTPRYWCSQPTKIARKDDILISVRAPVGPTNVAAEDCCIGRGLAAIRPHEAVDQGFFLVCLRSFEHNLAALGFGTTFVAINKKQLLSFPIPLPPVAEQQRIVAKVDELMALCDRLEAAQAERERRRDRLTTASLSLLNHLSAGTPAFREHARCQLDHLPRLITQQGHVEQMRQTILNLAVRGDLVPQDQKDEPASILLKRLALDAAEYARERRLTPLAPESADCDDFAFRIPDGWTCARLASLFRVITDGDHQPPPKAREGVAFLTIGNVTTGRLDFSNCRFVSPDYFNSIAEHRRPVQGDILYTVVGATFGRPCLVNTQRDFCVQRHIAILKPCLELNVRFLCLLLESPHVYGQACRSVTGTAQPTIGLRPLRSFEVLLPPLAEQHRIVVKVDKLMAVCDQLEGQLAIAETESRRLLEAVLHEALASVG